jgi:hypothetical protein
LLRAEASAEDERVEYLWPDCVDAWRVWQLLQTQWRVGMAGATGLDYAAVRAVLDEEGLQGEARADAWSGVRAAEAATLQVWAEQRKKTEQGLQ